MILSTHKINAFLFRIWNQATGRAQLYDYRQTLYWSNGGFRAIWDSSGTPIIKAGLEHKLYRAFPDELRQAMLKTAENLEEEARKIRAMYP